MFSVSSAPETYRGDVLDLGQRRMEWLSQRQKIIAGNIANSDTPGYAPADAASFDDAVASFDVTPSVTNAMHIGLRTGGVASVTQRREHAPDGNAVSLDQQMEKVADTDDQQKLASTIYKSYVSMFNTALDK